MHKFYQTIRLREFNINSRQHVKELLLEAHNMATMDLFESIVQQAGVIDLSTDPLDTFIMNFYIREMKQRLTKIN